MGKRRPPRTPGKGHEGTIDVDQLTNLDGAALQAALRSLESGTLLEIIKQANLEMAQKIAEALYQIGGEYRGTALIALERAWSQTPAGERAGDNAIDILQKIINLQFKLLGEATAKDFIDSLEPGLVQSVAQAYLESLKTPSAPNVDPPRPSTPPPPDTTIPTPTADALAGPEMPDPLDVVVDEAETTGFQNETDIKTMMPSWDAGVFKKFVREQIGFDPNMDPLQFFQQQNADLIAATRRIEQQIESATAQQCQTLIDEDIPNLWSKTLEEITTPQIINARNWLQELQRGLQPSETTLISTFEHWIRYLTRLGDGFDQFSAKVIENQEDLIITAHLRKTAAEDEQARQADPQNAREKLIDQRIENLAEQANSTLLATARLEQAIYSTLAQDKRTGENKRANEQYLIEQLEDWQKIINALAKIENIDLADLNLDQAMQETSQARAADPDQFRYKLFSTKTLDWAKNTPPKQLLEQLGLPDAGPVADAFFKAADYLEAVKRVLMNRILAERKRVADQDAIQQRLEQVVEEEACKKDMLMSRAEFFALAHILHSGATDAETRVQDYLQTTDATEKRNKLKQLFIEAVTQRGVCVPAEAFRNLATGETRPATWDRVAIKDSTNPRGFINVYGEIITLDKYQVTIRVYNRFKDEWGAIETYPKDQWAGSPRYANPSSLDGRAAIALAKLSGIPLSDRGPNKNLRYVLAGDFVPGTVAMNTGKRHGIKFDDGYNYALPTGEARDLARETNFDGNKYVSRQRAIENPHGTEYLFKNYRILMVSGAKNDPERYLEILRAVKSDQLTLFADHHTLASTKESSGIRYFYNLLDTLGVFDEWTPERKTALKRAIEQIQHEDNKSHPQWGKDWATKSPVTILGLMRRLTLGQLIKFFEQHPEPDSECKELTAAELASLGLTQASELQQKTVQEAQARLAELDQQGLVLPDTEYGTVVILVSPPVQSLGHDRFKILPAFFPGSADAIHGLLNPNSEYDKRTAYVIWNPWSGKHGQWFMATDGQIIEDLHLGTGAGESVRGTMYFGGSTYLGLEGFIKNKLLRGRSISLKPGLVNACRRERGELRKVRGKKEIEKITNVGELCEKAPELAGPVPLHVKNGRVQVPSERTGGKAVEVRLSGGLTPDKIDPHKHYRAYPIKLEYRGRLGTPLWTIEILGEEPNADILVAYQTWFEQEYRKKCEQEASSAWTKMSPREQDATVRRVAAREAIRAFEYTRNTLAVA